MCDTSSRSLNEKKVEKGVLVSSKNFPYLIFQSPQNPELEILSKGSTQLIFASFRHFYNFVKDNQKSLGLQKFPSQPDLTLTKEGTLVFKFWPHQCYILDEDRCTDYEQHLYDKDIEHSEEYEAKVKEKKELSYKLMRLTLPESPTKVLRQLTNQHERPAQDPKDL